VDIKNLVDEKKIINWRRYIHMYPEVAFTEVETAKYIVNELANYPDLEIHRPSGNAVVAVLKGAKPGKIIGLRADFDALPVNEEADVEFKSKNPGVSHLCGHDCHAAMLLGAVDALYKIKDELAGTVKFIFQHAEELPPGGAKGIVESKILNDVEAFYAAHVFPDDPVGIVKSATGPVSANSDMFAIKIFGKGTHAAMPETGIDPLLIGAQIVQALNFIVSRNVSAFERAVLTVGAFNAGTSFNIIPDTAEIKGTIRTFSADVRDLMEKRMKEVAEGICKANGAVCEIDYKRGYSSTINDEKLHELFCKTIEKTYPDLKIAEMKPMMGGEDFSAYGSIAPTLFAGLCAGPASGEVFMNHHPKFNINEEVLPIGTAIAVAFALELVINPQ